MPAIFRPDKDLITACLEGDQTSWDQLVDKYGGLVYTIACQNVPGSTEAEEVFHNVFMIVLKSLPKLAKEESLGRWLSTVTEREAQRVSQRHKRRVVRDQHLGRYFRKRAPVITKTCLDPGNDT